MAEISLAHKTRWVKQTSSSYPKPIATHNVQAHRRLLNRMGMRGQPRKPVEVPVRIFGTDNDGRVFSEKVTTVNISRNGAEVSSVRPELGLDEIVGLTYGNNRVHFRVKWIGQPGTPHARRLGLLSIVPEKPLWGFSIPPDAVDNYQPTIVERRKNPRYRCQNSVEIHVQEGVSFWGTVAGLGLDGCYVEIPIPLELGKRLKIGIWFGQAKAWAEARVTHNIPGLGVGMKFTEMSEPNLDQIRRFLDTVTPLCKKSHAAGWSVPYNNLAWAA